MLVDEIDTVVKMWCNLENCEENKLSRRLCAAAVLWKSYSALMTKKREIAKNQVTLLFSMHKSLKSLYYSG